MIDSKYDTKRLYDELFEVVMKGTAKAVKEKDDDALFLIVGDTGTGKSMLMLHACELLNPDFSVEYIGMDQVTHATALKMAKDKKGIRICVDDEANVNKRDATTKKNKDRLDLYMAIRGLNIIHFWCNPSVEMLDKPFIEERIKALIFIFTKDVKRPRVFYYFRKDDLLNMMESEKNIKQRTLHRKGKEYAYFKGWFKDYTGFLKTPYIEKKKKRMDNKIEDYFKTYGGEYKKQIEIAKDFGVSKGSISLWSKELIKAEYLIEDEDYIENESRSKLYTPEGIEKLRERDRNLNLVSQLAQNKSPYLNIPAFSSPSGRKDEGKTKK